MTSIAEVCEIQPCVPRTMGRQKHRNNVEADTPSAYWKRNLYLPILDHLVNELDKQLVKPRPGFQAQLLIPGVEAIPQQVVNINSIPRFQIFP